MAIQRFYNLPSCSLQIEGISHETGGSLSILTNFECKFHHNDLIISGGRELLNSLAESTSKYAQFLQIGNPITISGECVCIEPQGIYTHKLKIKANATSPESMEIELNTVELFDLMESIDCLCLDSQILLNIDTKIEPVISNSKQVSSFLPALIGVSSLGLVGAIVFLIPPPKTDPNPQPISVNLPRNSEQNLNQNLKKPNFRFFL